MDDDPPYNVGYRNPPTHTRFKPGQSGNHKGRPKNNDAGNAPEELLEKQLLRKVVMTENGSTKKVPVMEAIAMQLIAKAAKGDLKSIISLFNIMQARPKNQSARERKLEKEIERLDGELAQRRTPLTDEEKMHKINELMERVKIRVQGEHRWLAETAGMYDI